MVTCWERADLLAFLCVMFYCGFVSFPCGVLGQVWCLIVSISDLCLLSYFLYEASLDIILCIEQRVDQTTQAGPHLCCSYATNSRFFATRRVLKHLPLLIIFSYDVQLAASKTCLVSGSVYQLPIHPGTSLPLPRYQKTYYYIENSEILGQISCMKFVFQKLYFHILLYRK